MFVCIICRYLKCNVSKIDFLFFSGPPNSSLFSVFYFTRWLLSTQVRLYFYLALLLLWNPFFSLLTNLTYTQSQSHLLFAKCLLLGYISSGWFAWTSVVRSRGFLGVLCQNHHTSSSFVKGLLLLFKYKLIPQEQDFVFCFMLSVEKYVLAYATWILNKYGF